MVCMLSQKNEALISLRIVSFTVILVQNKCTTQGRGVHLVIHTTREKCLSMWWGRTHSHSFSIATHAYKISKKTFLILTTVITVTDQMWYFTTTSLMFVCLHHRYQQVFVDGPYWGKHRHRQTHQGARLLHSHWRVPGGPRGLTCPAQLPHVQDVLLPLWPGLHRSQWVTLQSYYGITHVLVLLHKTVGLSFWLSQSFPLQSVHLVMTEWGTLRLGTKTLNWMCWRRPTQQSTGWLGYTR